VIATFIGLAAAGRSSSALAGPVTIKGSDTMVVLGQRWAEEFMKKNPKTTIQVTGGGSGTGISALINGTTDICEASRAMKDAEKKQLADKAGAPPVETAVARDGLSVYVNDSNPINELTMAQLKAIFTGKTKSWKELGGPDATIIPYSRENSSGTYVFFKEHVLDNLDYTPRAQAMPGTAAVVNAVAREVRNRLRRRRVREGHQGRQGEERRRVHGRRPIGRDHQERDLSPVASALLLHTGEAAGRHQDLHGLGSVARGAGHRREGRVLPDPLRSPLSATLTRPRDASIPYREIFPAVGRLS